MKMSLTESVPETSTRAITLPFFELQTPEFARKLVWTVRINYIITKLHNFSLHKYAKNENVRIPTTQLLCNFIGAHIF